MIEGVGIGLIRDYITSGESHDDIVDDDVHSAEPLRVAAASSHIDSLALSLKTKDDPRSLDEIKADVALDLLSGHCLCGSAPKGGGKVNLTVPADTARGAADTPEGDWWVRTGAGRSGPEGRIDYDRL